VGCLGSDNGQFNRPYDVVTSGDGSVYVAETGNHRIHKLTGSGTAVTNWGGFGTGNGQFNSPKEWR